MTLSNVEIYNASTETWVKLTGAIVATKPVIEQTSRAVLDFAHTWSAAYTVSGGLTRTGRRYFRRLLAEPGTKQLLHNGRKPR